MNADILRLILFLAGIALILGIYFWDRRKKINARVNAIRRAERRQREQQRESAPPEVRREPVWDAAQVDAEHPDPGDALRQLGEIVQDERPRKQPGDPVEQTAFSFDRGEMEPQVQDLPVKILQINLLARKGEISGELIGQAAREVGLEAGEMQIFHRYLDPRNHSKALFSMASMVEPGVFPLQAMTGFSTPGVTLFAQLPGPRDGVEIFDTMLSAAERLGVLFDAEVLDETRSGMSRQTIEHIRAEIREHSRLIRLAKSRR